jgi:hypothetical protein
MERSEIRGLIRLGHSGLDFPGFRACGAPSGLRRSAFRDCRPANVNCRT